MIEIFFIFIIIIYINVLIIKSNYKYNDQYNQLSLDRQNYFVKNLFKSYFLFRKVYCCNVDKLSKFGFCIYF